MKAPVNVLRPRAPAGAKRELGRKSAVELQLYDMGGDKGTGPFQAFTSFLSTLSTAPVGALAK